MTPSEPFPNPREHHVQGSFPHPRQPIPGHESEMRPRPDFGEESYQGTGKLTGEGRL